MIETRHKNLQKHTFNLPTLAISIIVILVALTGLFNQTILSAGIVSCCIVLLQFDKLHLAYPVMIFYGSFCGTLFGISISRIYTLLILFNAIIRISSKTRFKLKYLPPIVIFLLYSIVVMMPINFATTAFIMLDILGCFIVVSRLHSATKEDIPSFFRIYVIVCVCSFFSGIVNNNFIGDEYHVTRFLATFEDPNYMGFFFTLAVFATITLKLFDKRIRYLVVVALYAMILTSLSITAIVINVLMWLFYLVIMKKMKWWSAIVIVLVIALLSVCTITVSSIPKLRCWEILL